MRKNRFENRAIPRGGNVSGDLASSATTFGSVRHRLQVRIGHRKRERERERGGTVFSPVHLRPTVVIVTERGVSVCRTVGGEAGEATEDGLNVYPKFRLNGISIRAKRVPKGNLPNVTSRDPIADVESSFWH